MVFIYICQFQVCFLATMPELYSISTFTCQFPDPSLTVTSTYGLDIEPGIYSIKLNQCAKYLDQMSFIRKLLSDHILSYTCLSEWPTRNPTNPADKT